MTNLFFDLFGRDHSASAAMKKLQRNVDDTADSMDHVSGASTEMSKNVEAASARLQRARDAEADAVGRLRVAEQRLTELRASGKASDSALAAAEERVATARRGLARATTTATTAAAGLRDAQARLASAHDDLVAHTDRHSATLDRFRKALDAAGSRATSLLKPLGGMATTVGAVGSTALTAAPLIGKAAVAIGHVLGAALQASPALLGMAAAGAFVGVTLKQVLPAIGKEFEPVTAGFTHAGEQAGRLAAQGIRPLAADFSRLNMPNISAGMDRIATSTNGVVRRFLEWANSAPGIQAVKNITDAAASGFERIAPSVSRFAESLGNMLGRIAGVSTAAGASGLAGVLDYLTGKMDKINAASVQGGIDKLKDTFHHVKDAVSQTIGVVERLIGFWRAHRTEIGLVQDALSILAIAFGGPAVAVVAAVGIIIRHWDDLKAAWQALAQFFNTNNSTTGFLDNLVSAAQTILPSLQAAFEQIKTAVMPVLQEIWDKIQNQVIPALGAFAQAIAPVVAWFVDVLGPVVATTMQTILQVISGVLDIITGVFKVFTALLTGDWGLLWEGIKQIASGAWQIISSIISGALENIGHIVWAALGGVVTTMVDSLESMKRAVVDKFNAIVDWCRSIGGRISGALGDLGSLLYNAGASIISGLLRGIVNKAEEVYNYVSSIGSKIAALKGPRSYDLKLLVPAGQALMQGLHSGILAGLGPVLTTVTGIADRIAATFSQAAQPVLSDAGKAAQEILDQYNRGGNVFEDFSFRGESDLVGEYNDQIAKAFYSSGSHDPGQFLASYIASQQTMAQQPAQLQITSDGSRFADLLIEVLRNAIRTRAGGNVQLALGKS